MEGRSETEETDVTEFWRRGKFIFKDGHLDAVVLVLCDEHHARSHNQRRVLMSFK